MDFWQQLHGHGKADPQVKAKSEKNIVHYL